jgi:hypothetical protein
MMLVIAGDADSSRRERKGEQFGAVWKLFADQNRRGILLTFYNATNGKMQPPRKRRRIDNKAVAEVSFDSAARQEYLTGFHKRKLQRTKHAQELALKKARAERIEHRRKVYSDLIPAYLPFTD